MATQKLTFQPIKASFVYEEVTKLYEVKRLLLLEPATFVLPTEKSLVVSFWTSFQNSRQPRRIRRNWHYQKILLMQGYLS